MSRSQFRTIRIVVLLLYVVVAAAYSLVDPAFESPDELLHFRYVESILRTKRLPIAQGDLTEDFQAPLYYTAGALLTSWIPPGHDAADIIQRNPFWPWRIAEAGVDNKTQFLHGPEERFPWTGPWLRLHLLRLLSILFGLIAVWQTGEFALLLRPRRYDHALLATAFVGFLPQFAYVSSSVTNDVAVVAFSALSAVALGRLLYSLSSDSRDVRRAVLLGVFLGLGILSEVSVLAVWAVAMTILALYLFANRRSAPRPAWSNLGLPALASLVITTPFFARNWVLYGEPTGLAGMDAVWGRREPPLTLLETLRETPQIWTSTWARFGYGQIPIPTPIYIVCLSLTVVALASLGLGLVKWIRSLQAAAETRGSAALVSIDAGGSVQANRPGRFSQWAQVIPWRDSSMWLFAYAALLVLTLIPTLLRYAANSPTGSFGREAFAALPAFAALLTAGWTELGASRRRPAVAIAASSAMLAFSVWALVAVLRPAYVLPTYALPASAGPITEIPGLRLGDAATVTKVRLVDPTLTPGKDALLEVEWLPLRKTERPLIFFARLVGPGNEMLSERDSYPGLGRTSTTFWEPGRVFTDLIRMPVDEEAARAAAPAQVRIWVGFYDRATNQILLARDWPSGEPVLGVVGEGRLPAQQRRTGRARGPALATVGDNLELASAWFPAEVQAGATLPVSLEWTVLKPLPYDAKLFIHLAPVGQDQPVAQVDEPVMGGRYPRRLWAAGEVLPDDHQLQIPETLAPGTYRLRAGLYRDEPGWPRLPIQTPAGPVPDNAYELGIVRVAKPGQ